MMHNVEIILFDMGGTLRGSVKSTRAGKKKALHAIIQLSGGNFDPKKFTRLINQRAKNYKKWAEETCLELNEEELWVKWMLPDCSETLIRKHAIQLNQLYRDSINTRTVFPETKDVVMQLFRNGYRLGLVSNTTSSVEVPAALRALQIFGCFETVILSSVLGKRKPDPSILLEAVRRMDGDPHTCVYIGDRAERDVAAARAAGFAKTVIISDPSSQSKITDPALTPDHFIQNLSELPALFPPLAKKSPKPKYNASFSTMWGIKSTPTLTDFFECSQRLGFAAVELNHMVNSDLLQGFNPNGYTISSIHEPCPADISAEKLKEKDYLISSTNEDFRRIGIDSIKRSIDMAKQFGSKVVVIHAGHVDPSKQLENRMRALIASGHGKIPQNFWISSKN